MTCKNCGEDLFENAKFCKFCGTKVESESESVEESMPKAKNVCASCVADVSNGAEFCKSCGEPVNNTDIENDTSKGVDAYDIKQQTLVDSNIKKSKKKLSTKGTIAVIASAVVVIVLIICFITDGNSTGAVATIESNCDAGAVMDLSLNEFSDKFNKCVNAFYSDSRVDFDINQYWNKLVEPMTAYETNSGTEFTTYSAYILGQYLVTATVTDKHVRGFNVCFDYDDNSLPVCMACCGIMMLTGLDANESDCILSTIRDGITENTWVYKDGILYGVESSTCSYKFFAASESFVSLLEKSGKCKIIYDISFETTASNVETLSNDVEVSTQVTKSETITDRPLYVESAEKENKLCSLEEFVAIFDKCYDNYDTDYLSAQVYQFSKIKNFTLSDYTSSPNEEPVSEDMNEYDVLIPDNMDGFGITICTQKNSKQSVKYLYVAPLQSMTSYAYSAICIMASFGLDQDSAWTVLFEAMENPGKCCYYKNVSCSYEDSFLSIMPVPTEAIATGGDDFIKMFEKNVLASDDGSGNLTYCNYNDFISSYNEMYSDYLYEGSGSIIDPFYLNDYVNEYSSASVNNEYHYIFDIPDHFTDTVSIEITTTEKNGDVKKLSIVIADDDKSSYYAELCVMTAFGVDEYKAKQIYAKAIECSGKPLYYENVVCKYDGQSKCFEVYGQSNNEIDANKSTWFNCQSLF